MRSESQAKPYPVLYRKQYIMMAEERVVRSNYFINLDSVAKKRYEEKLKVSIGTIPDPYSSELKGWEDNVVKWPAVEYGDIYNYLVTGKHARCIKEAMKSLDGYNFFVSGHVQTCFFNDLGSDSPVCLLKAKVTPSQRTRDKPHETWVCLDKQKGYVIATHCTCKAGLGEACSHIAATLFKLEAANKLGLNKESQTSVACIWNQFYRKKVVAKPISQINFANPKHPRSRKPVRKHTRNVTECCNDMKEDEAFEALEQLQKICPTACILTKDDSDTDSASEDEDLPPIPSRFHDIGYQGLSREELECKCKDFVKDFKASHKQVENLESMTRAQGNSALWRRHREGRITATHAHDIKTLRPSTSRKKILIKLMKYETVDLSKVEAVAFGNKFESVAREMYRKSMTVHHTDFTLVDCGLIIDETFPLFAATPDGVRHCSCHGSGLLEIKCTYKHKDKLVQDIPDQDATFYLEKGSLELKRGHKYYTQVQFQMYVCNKLFCDFVVYSHEGIFINTVPYDPEFAKELIEKCYTFAVSELVPEILQQKLNSA